MTAWIAAAALCVAAIGAAAGEVRRADAGAASPHWPLCTLAPDDPSRLAVEPCRPAPPAPGAARRAVPQIIMPMPMPMPPPALPPAPAPVRTPAWAKPAVPPRAPLPVNSCELGVCRDAAGVLYNGGVGNVTLDPNGRPCVRNGAWLQCF
ncbi:hypothetical protein [Janthinobacterium fluminis]|uniref:Uncharacterized protein n=1 Tax=Janthinobacterium fluminis TaxID=2987524 RepID=A0ABT5JXW8_9BURK|nr:hypothetical protein [Janthinobacterium fluminis]MDC8757582.1 hypothetical protein [Janthinobacterium fluminis]